MAAFALALLAAGAALAEPPPPRFEGAPLLESADGYFLLEWSAAAGDAARPEFELQEAPSARFAEPERVYLGRRQSLFLSGFRDGSRFVRGRLRLDSGPWGAWSPPLELRVAHHSLSFALGLFAVGGLLFAATLVTLIAGERRSRAAAEDSADA